MVQRAARSRREVRQETHDTVLSVTSSGVGVDEDKRTVLEVRKFETEPAWVRVNAGVTKNLGNYESLRVDVSISAPCYVEEIEDVQKNVAGLVADMLDAEIEEYLGKEA